MKMTVRTLTLVVGIFSGQSAWAQQDLPGKDQVQVRDVSLSGTGCTASEEGGDTVTLASSTEYGAVDRLDFTFAAFKAEKPKPWRQFCQITVDLAYPEGWQYSLASGTIFGRSELASKVKAELKIEMGFMGNGQQKATISRTETGFVSGNYYLKDKFNRTLWSPCGEPKPLQLSIGASLRGRSKRPSSFTVRGMMKDESFQLIWRKCS